MWDPKGRLLATNVAMPEDLTVAVPSSVAPLWKLTVPAGLPVGVGVMAAVKVTACPTVAGLGEPFRVVEVGVCSSIKAKADEVEAANVTLPE